MLNYGFGKVTLGFCVLKSQPSCSKITKNDLLINFVLFHYLHVAVDYVTCVLFQSRAFSAVVTRTRV